MKDVLKIVFVIIGSLVGAGFASGQEMYMFFYVYGIYGIIGIIVCAMLFIVMIYKVFAIILRYNISGYSEFVKLITRNNSNNKYLNFAFVINAIVKIFLIITFYIMIAGFGAFFEQEYKLPAIVGSGILSGLCFVTLMTNTNGVVKANQILTPVLILFIIIIGIINVCTGGGIGKNITCSNGNFVLSAVLYCSYNSICIIPVLVTLRKYIKTKKQALWASLICGAVICILAIIIYFLLGRIDGNIEGFEMPAVYAVSCIFENLKNVYAFIILASIYTTNITLGMSLLESVSSSRKCYVCVTAILCFTSVLVSQFGFSNLVSLLYPVFGYLGLIQLFLICVTDNNLK